MAGAREQTDMGIFETRDAQGFKRRTKCLILCLSINPDAAIPEGGMPVPASSPSGDPSPTNGL